MLRRFGNKPPVHRRLSLRDFFGRIYYRFTRVSYEFWPDSLADSGDSHTAGAYNSPTPAAGPRGSRGGYSFPGTSGDNSVPYILIPNGASVRYFLQEGTIGVWYYARSAPSVSAPIYEEQTGSGTQQRCSIYHLSNGSLEARVTPSDGGTTYTATFSDFSRYVGRWVFLALTYNSDGHQLYVNGVQVASENTGSRPSFTNTEPARICVGAHYDSSSRANDASVDGVISEFTIFGLKLSGAELLHYYTQSQDPYSPQIGVITRGGPVYSRIPSRTRLDTVRTGDFNRRFFSAAGSSLFGSWTLDEAGSTVYDRSGNSRNGTIAGSVASADGAFTRGKYFPGSTSDYINLGFTTDIGGEFTIIAWIKPDALPAAGAIGIVINKSRISASIGSDFPVQLFINENGKVRCTTSNGTDTTADTAVEVPVVPGEWVPVITSFSQTGGYHFIATPRGFNIVSHSSGITTNSYNWYIGRAYSQTYNTFFKGSISDVTILSRSITKNEALEYIQFSQEYRQAKAPLFFNKLYLPAQSNEGVASEIATSSDTIDYHLSVINPSITESSSASDTVTGRVVLNITEAISESSTSTDTVEARLSVLNPSISETGTGSDSVSIVKQSMDLSISETGVSSDTVGYVKDIFASITESGTSSDSVSFIPLEAIAESATATDTVSALQIKAQLYYSSLTGYIDLFTEDFFSYGYFDTLNLLQSNVFGDLTINESVNFIDRLSSTYTIPFQLNIQSVFISDPLQLTVTLRSENIVMSSTNGILDIYLTALPPVITEIANEVKTYFTHDGVIEDISSSVVSLDISYSLDKYVGELNATIKDERLYDILNLKQFFGQRIFSVYVDGQNIGEFFFETRSGSAEFGSSEISVWGRTKNALLGSPYSGRLSKTWDIESTTAKDIVDEILLDFPDINLVWNIMNYPILPGKVASDGRSAIEIISSLAEPVGGRVTTNFAGDLIVDYKWKQVAV